MTLHFLQWRKDRIRGHRVEYTPELLEDARTPAFGAVSLHTNYLLWVIVGLLSVAAFILILYLFDKRQTKRAEKVETKDI